MNWKQAVMLGVAGGTLAILFTRVASVAPLPEAPPASPAGAAANAVLTAEIDRLHQRLQAPIVPMQSFRHAFASRAPAPVVRAPATAGSFLSGPAAASAAPRSERPALRLIGLAEDGGPGGPFRTAIIAGPAGLQFATVGDIVGSGYRVTAIREDAVELSGAADLPSVVLELE